MSLDPLGAAGPQGCPAELAQALDGAARGQYCAPLKRAWRVVSTG